MIYEAIVRADAILVANFAADMATLETDKSLSGLDTGVTVHDHRRAGDLLDNESLTLPLIGLFSHGATTAAKNQTKRDADVDVEAEYICRGVSEANIRQQTELAAEAFCMSIDRMHGGTGVIEAGSPESGIQITLGGDYESAGREHYEGSCTARWMMVTRDEGL